MKYEFPAVITYDKNENVYYVNFPDFTNIFTDGETLTEALENGQDVLNLMLLNSELEGIKIPVPSKLNEVNLGVCEIATLIKADTEEYMKLLPETSKCAV